MGSPVRREILTGDWVLDVMSVAGGRPRSTGCSSPATWSSTAASRVVTGSAQGLIDTLLELARLDAQPVVPVLRWTSTMSSSTWWSSTADNR
jgi:hypothetical protein